MKMKLPTSSRRVVSGGDVSGTVSFPASSSLSIEITAEPMCMSIPLACACHASNVISAGDPSIVCGRSAGDRQARR